jgi:hypothetical protein
VTYKAAELEASARFRGLRSLDPIHFFASRVTRSQRYWATRTMSPSHPATKGHCSTRLALLEPSSAAPDPESPRDASLEAGRIGARHCGRALCGSLALRSRAALGALRSSYKPRSLRSLYID